MIVGSQCLRTRVGVVVVDNGVIIWIQICSSSSTFDRVVEEDNVDNSKVVNACTLASDNRTTK